MANSSAKKNNRRISAESTVVHVRKHFYRRGGGFVSLYKHQHTIWAAEGGVYRMTRSHTRVFHVLHTKHRPAGLFSEIVTYNVSFHSVYINEVYYITSQRGLTGVTEYFNVMNKASSYSNKKPVILSYTCTCRVFLPGMTLEKRDNCVKIVVNKLFTGLIHRLFPWCVCRSTPEMLLSLWPGLHLAAAWSGAKFEMPLVTDVWN